MALDRQELQSDEELLSIYRNTGDLAMRNALVERYSYIAEILAKKFLRHGAEYDDLYQVAVLALIKAIDRFDVSMGNKLSTFLTPSIAGELKNYFRDKMNLLKVSRESTRLYHLITKTAAEMGAQSGRAPTPAALAEHLHMPLDKVLAGLEYEINLVSLDSKISGSETSLSEMIPDEADGYAEVENKDFFESCLKLLTKPEQELVTLRFINEYSQSETAKRLNVSQMFISRLERKIIDKLKTAFKEDG